MYKKYMGLRDRITLLIKQVEGQDKKELQAVLKYYISKGRIIDVNLLHKHNIKV